MMGSYDEGLNGKVMFDCSNEMKKYKCETCPSFQTNFVASLKYHFTDGHKLEDLTEDIYKCMKCLFVSNSEYVMGRHSFFSECATRDKAERMKRFIHYRRCHSNFNLDLEDKHVTLFHDECEKADGSKFGKRQTELRAESNQMRSIKTSYSTPKSEDVRFFVCDHCPSKFKEKRYLRRHLTYRHSKPEDIKWIVCAFCPCKFQRKHQLQSHVTFRHTKPEDIEWFICDYCPSKFKMKQELQRHKTFCHTKPEDIKWFKCDYCPSKFKRRRTLKPHISYCHSKPEDIKWFTCDECPSKFKRKQHLQNHVTSRHTKPEDIQWFVCDSCPSKFKRKDQLQKHTTRHTKR